MKNKKSLIPKKLYNFGCSLSISQENSNRWRLLSKFSVKVLPIIFSSSSESDGGISYFVQLLATVLFPYSPESVFFTVSETLAEAAPLEFASNENGFSSSTDSCFSISKMCHIRFFFSTIF